MQKYLCSVRRLNALVSIIQLQNAIGIKGGDADFNDSKAGCVREGFSEEVALH